MTTIDVTWASDAPPDAVVFADPSSVYGIRRTDSGAVVVPYETPLVAAGAGQYTYTFADDDSVRVSYEIWVRISDGTDTYFIHQFKSSPVSISAENRSIDSPALILASALREKGVITDYGRVDPADTLSRPVWPSTIGMQLSNPDEFVTLYDSGGVIDGIVHTATGPASIEHADVQLRVRCKSGDYIVGKSKARELKDTLLSLRNYEVSIGSEVEGEPPELYRINAATPLSKEAYIGPDDKNRPSFTVNVRTSISRLS